VCNDNDTQELDVLKTMAVASCRAWKDADKPKYGNIFLQYKKDKLLYKQRIREEQANETSSLTNDLHDALQKKVDKTFGKFGIQNLKIKSRTLFK
jgi:hypothetical protein